MAALILALLAFALAAAASSEIGSSWPILHGASLQAGRMSFFWLGVVLFLVAAWGWKST